MNAKSCETPEREADGSARKRLRLVHENGLEYGFSWKIASNLGSWKTCSKFLFTAHDISPMKLLRASETSKNRTRMKTLIQFGLIQLLAIRVVMVDPKFCSGWGSGCLFDRFPETLNLVNHEDLLELSLRPAIACTACCVQCAC